MLNTSYLLDQGGKQKKRIVKPSLFFKTLSLFSEILKIWVSRFFAPLITMASKNVFSATRWCCFEWSTIVFVSLFRKNINWYRFCIERWLIRYSVTPDRVLTFMSRKYGSVASKMVIPEKSNYFKSVTWDHHKIRSNRLLETLLWTIVLR